MKIINFIIPLILLILGSAYILCKTLDLIIKFKNKKHSYIIITILISLAVYFKSIWAVYVIYSCSLIIIFYIIDKVCLWLKLKRIQKIFNSIYCKGITVFAISGLIVTIGIINANNHIVKTYDIKTNQLLNENIKITFASDLHLGTLDFNSEVDSLVELANKENCDIFIILGDFYDEFTKEKNIYQAIDKISKINTKYGIYYVEGNHDLLTSKIRDYLKEKNIKTLEDESILINNELYLIGRKDYRRNKLKGYNNRLSLDELLKDIDKSKNTILLDHQPITKELNNNITLQLSGHTHAGQIIPANPFLKYGYYQTDNYQLVVSAGFGVWDSEVRIGSNSELVSVNIHN